MANGSPQIRDSKLSQRYPFRHLKRAAYNIAHLVFIVAIFQSFKIIRVGTG
jgi:hypothetical protein